MGLIIALPSLISSRSRINSSSSVLSPPNDEIRTQSISLYDITFLDVKGNHLIYRTSTDFPLPANELGKLSIAYFVEADRDSFPLTLKGQQDFL